MLVAPKDSFPEDCAKLRMAQHAANFNQTVKLIVKQEHKTVYAHVRLRKSSMTSSRIMVTNAPPYRLTAHRF
jgi:hypothetical protein